MCQDAKSLSYCKGEILTFFFPQQPNYELLEKEVEKRKVALQEAKLKAKGLNPDGTPALSTLGGFSPASKPCKMYLELKRLGGTESVFLLESFYIWKLHREKWC